jgi:predicted ribosome quality control (RQC) complex YloA/Tae2 family protein
VFAADLSATLFLDRGEALRFDLHPGAGWARLIPRPPESAALAPEARIVSVTAPPDERRLRIELQEGSRFRGGSRALVVELHTNQWNALLVDNSDRRIVSVLRARDAGGRSLRAGAPYVPPHGEPRFGSGRVQRDDAWAEWMRVLSPLAPPQRRGELVRRFADASPVNSASIIGHASTSEDADALAEAFERWWALRTLSPPRPVLLHLPAGAQPYPMPLEGIESEDAKTLIAAMDTAAERSASADPASASTADAELLERARKRLAGARRRVGSLEQEMRRVGEADRLRARGDLLLAYLQYVTPGTSSVRLPSFEDGTEVEVELDPTLRPNENAKRLYDEAARRQRAEERVPELLAAARRDVERWEAAVAAGEAGELPAAAIRLLTREPAKKSAAAGPQAERMPFRLYRTSGGLEVRVGRTSRDNDRVTFGHSAPSDVWLHARSVPGSHVVLRWADADAPPARDLEEAAVLAAFYSKARSSGTVAVDWTRRKHVRKPRGAPPGRVTIQHAKTLFVAPDPAVEERLRVDAELPSAS